MASHPNILLITADQMRWDCIGAIGNDRIRTPNLDKLASGGVVFRNAFAPNPICVPARASIMTGNYSNTCTGCKDNGGRIRPDQPLLTEVLKFVGYRTYAMGKLHFVPYQPPGMPRLVHGFEHVDLTESGRLIDQFDPACKMQGLEDYADYLKSVGWGGYTRGHGIGNNDPRPSSSPLPKEHYVDHWIADCTLAQIDRHCRDFSDRPFFMWMSSPKPHSPYDPPRPFDAMYDPRQMPAPFGFEQDCRLRNPNLLRTAVSNAITTLSPAAIQTIRAHYYGSISFLDEQIGRVVDNLAERNMLDNTLIVFSSDHGDLLGDFGSFFKSVHQNGSVRVPFIVRGPGVACGCLSNALVGLQDILPTFAKVADAEVGQDVHGRDLTPVLADPRQKVRDWYYSQCLESPRQTVMVTDGRWKYIYSEENAVEELYDQENDMKELVNLAEDSAHAEILASMRKQLRLESQAVGDLKIFDEQGNLRKSEIDIDAIRRLPISGMGWRWA